MPRFAMDRPAPDFHPMDDDLDALTTQQLEDRAFGTDSTLRGIVRQRREAAPAVRENSGEVVFRVRRRTLQVLAGAGLFLIGGLTSWALWSDQPTVSPIEAGDVYSAGIEEEMEIVALPEEAELVMEMDEMELEDIEMVMGESEAVLEESEEILVEEWDEVPMDQ